MKEIAQPVLIALILLALLPPLSLRTSGAFDTPTASVELQQDILVSQREILTDGTVLFSIQITTEQPTTAVAIVSLRWWADRPGGIGDRLAWVRLNGAFVGAPALQDSCPTCPMQVSSQIVALLSLSAGSHTIEVVMGGCCGLYSSPFWVGRWSRLDVIY